MISCAPTSSPLASCGAVGTSLPSLFTSGLLLLLASSQSRCGTFASSRRALRGRSWPITSSSRVSVSVALAPTSCHLCTCQCWPQAGSMCSLGSALDSSFDFRTGLSKHEFQGKSLGRYSATLDARTSNECCAFHFHSAYSRTPSVLLPTLSSSPSCRGRRT